MSVNTAQNNEINANSHTLSAREQEVMNLLLAGSIPKEIASTLNISHSTVLDHKKSIYSKLDVHSSNELFAKYSKERSSENNAAQTDKTGAAKAVFIRWDTFEDNFGSYTNFTPKVELIQDNYTETYAMCGNMSMKGMAYTGVNAYPDPSTLDAMKKMTSFSFFVLGDGNTYEAKIATTEARRDADYNYYAKIFQTENGVISEININIDELVPTYTIKTVPFVQSSIETLIIQTFSKGDFNLKFWDIKFF